MLSGNIQIEYDHLEAAGNAIITKNEKCEGERFERFKAAASEGKKHGSLFVAQVSHPGRQVPDTVQEHPVSASDIQLQGKLLVLPFPSIASFADFGNPFHV